MNPAAGSVVPAGAVGITKHSTVVERLRQRIEGCRRHHVNCENRYQQAHAEQLEIERRETVSLYQRSLEQRAKKSTGGSSSKQPQSKQPDPDSASSTEQRNNTLIAVRTSSQSRPRLPRDTRSLTHENTTHSIYSPSFVSPSISLSPRIFAPHQAASCTTTTTCSLLWKLVENTFAERWQLLCKHTLHFFKPECQLVLLFTKKPRPSWRKQAARAWMLQDLEMTSLTANIWSFCKISAAFFSKEGWKCGRHS